MPIRALFKNMKPASGPLPGLTFVNIRGDGSSNIEPEVIGFVRILKGPAFTSSATSLDRMPGIAYYLDDDLSNPEHIPYLLLRMSDRGSLYSIACPTHIILYGSKILPITLIWLHADMRGVVYPKVSSAHICINPCQFFVIHTGIGSWAIGHTAKSKIDQTVKQWIDTL